MNPFLSNREITDGGGKMLETVGEHWSDGDVHLLQDAGAGVYTVGINLRNTEELDGVSSQPLDWYQTLVNSERELDPIPGDYKDKMETGEFMIFIFHFHILWVCMTFSMKNRQNDLTTARRITYIKE